MREPILVTGGAGYIGSHVVRDLWEEDHYYPVIYDNLSTGNAEHVLYGDLVRGDTGDLDLLIKTIRSRGIRSVMHFAASISVPESVENPLKYYQNNTANSLSLIRACIETGVRQFVFSSTAAVYGVPAQSPVSEDTPPAPINPYGKSKLFTENILRDVSRSRKDFHYLALRYFNVAGADENCRIGQNYPLPTHLITLGLRTALGKIPRLMIYGTDYDTPDGTAVRDYIHVDDLSRVHLLALEHLKKTGKNGIYNCGYGRGFSVKEVVNRIRSVTGREFAIHHTERRSGDPPVLVASSDRIRRELGWNPVKDDLTRIIASAWAWEKKLQTP